ncbi:phage-related protein, tail component [Thiohalobacter thiocyanaticus]|uniref:Phage-related protein, tail component n=1 Tax=Thiohalobacter thiocyanaticus TaxID=585455 RepID=A0A1Z4VLF0_9GAMM|nr:TIR domain-containing protein [Thiohalobacter thiocyanaticus]BAZ92421.1 phage-related protein, tail component [Thiohalobacter thiocyanaticus]
MANGLLSGLGIKRKVFVSYHHGGDKAYYDAFINAFSNAYDVIHDNSVERAIDSSNTDYVIRRIRENFITGSSSTIVLCGAQTPYRKFVDWEIKATLDKQHGLIGVNLPSNPLSANSKYIVPDRLHDNIESGFAIWTNWASFTQSIQSVQGFIEQANSKPAFLINNNRALRQRNG